MKNNTRKYIFLLGTSGIFLILDQVTKQLIVNKFFLGESVEVIRGFFSFTYVRNKGAAFGFLHTAPEAFREPFFLLVPIIAIFVLGYLYYHTKLEDRLSHWALALILSGALGNLIDRIRFGYVVDFIDVYHQRWGHWPAFNIADSAIVVGVGLLFIQSLSGKVVPR